MEDFLNDTLDLVQGVVEPDCDCSGYYFYGTCEHVRMRTCSRLCLSPPLLHPLTSLPLYLYCRYTRLCCSWMIRKMRPPSKVSVYVCTRMYACMLLSLSLSPHTH